MHSVTGAVAEALEVAQHALELRGSVWSVGWVLQKPECLQPLLAVAQNYLIGPRLQLDIGEMPYGPARERSTLGPMPEGMNKGCTILW